MFPLLRKNSSRQKLQFPTASLHESTASGDKAHCFGFTSQSKLDTSEGKSNSSGFRTNRFGFSLTIIRRNNFQSSVGSTRKEEGKHKFVDSCLMSIGGRHMKEDTLGRSRSPVDIFYLAGELRGMLSAKPNSGFFHFGEKIPCPFHALDSASCNFRSHFEQRPNRTGFFRQTCHQWEVSS